MIQSQGVNEFKRPSTVVATTILTKTTMNLCRWDLYGQKNHIEFYNHLKN